MERKAALKSGLVMIAFLFLFVSAYADYEILTEVDFLSPTAKYEAQDLEDLSFDKQLDAIPASDPFPISLPLPEDRYIFSADYLLPSRPHSPAITLLC